MSGPHPGPACFILCELDPVEFAAAFLGAVWVGQPVALANPGWGLTERVEFDRLLREHPVPPGTILIPTGGTTGGVKLAVHDWSSLCAAVAGLSDFLGGGPVHSCCVLPLHHVSGLMQVVRSFLTEGQLRFDDAVTEGHCLSLVPTQLQRALRSAADVAKMKRSRAVFIGGAPMPEELAAEARDRRLPIIPVYGMTETAAMVAAVPNEDFLREPSPGALPLGPARFELTGAGQIRIQSPALFKGYQGQRPMDLSQGYLTGDLGRMDARGRLHVLGRLDGLILTGGEKVDPREVEKALLRLEGVAAARVVGEPHDEWGQQVVAYLTGSAAESEQTIRGRLRPELASYKLPKRIIWREG
ncbi:MAG: AMP-binding protein [Opitutales bacterium]